MYKINFFGWCSEDGHDKVWGYVTLGEGKEAELYNFWGRRGKKLAFKKHETDEHYNAWDASYDLQKRAREKCRPRTNGAYREIPVSNIERVCEGFYTEFEKQLLIAKLSN